MKQEGDVEVVQGRCMKCDRSGKVAAITADDPYVSVWLCSSCLHRISQQVITSKVAGGAL
jgi:ligand-binding sensor protein